MIIGKAISPFVLRKKGSAAAAFDADAQAFITATGITGTNATATNQLVLDLKAANIWTKMKAVYPMVGGTATAHKFNLKNPVDTNAAYRLVFTGGWTHSATGALPNGTNAYANTFLSTSAISLNSVHSSYYSRTNNTTAAAEIGGGNGGTNSYTIMQLRNPSSPANTYIWYNNSDAVDSTSGVNTSAFFIGSRTASNIIRLFRNSTRVINGTALSNATSVYSQYIGAYNNAGSPLWYTNRECAFSSIGDGLTDAEALALYNATQTFNTTLGRQV